MSSYYRVDLKATGENIRYWMRERNVTLADIEEALHLGSTTAVKAWRSGLYKPCLANAIALARILEVPVEKLIVVVCDE